MGTTSISRVARYLPVGFRRELSRKKLQQFADNNLIDVEFEFLDDSDVNLGDSSSSSDDFPLDIEDEDDDDESSQKVHAGTSNIEENRNFWDNQLQLLQTNVYKISAVEFSIRNATQEAIEEIDRSEIECSCSRQIMGSSARECRNCFMRQVSRCLQNAGFNSSICNTKWTSSHNLPSGEHTFLDVIHSTSKEKSDVRVIIELNFRSQFEMGKASEDYNNLVRKLPEMYVGKVERLRNIIKIMCMVAKRCLKENKMHIGPWRKQKYMQAKWLGPCKRNTSTNSLSMGYSQTISSKQKVKASMLTVDLLDKIPNIHCTAVEVV
ncbi:uncharacterized protein LOC127105751 isoform X1 [Lathyrus oleraceus]|uniref:Uncharacterized protein n=1 Tax=Pisum sativum TaxID=3888 RepID=A0A9D4ZY74_PEA|nr:uncharacterized protein LOC127105751 isoform X1 [Pisum sativum]KAI5386615.1 hypothetical protein KIW84_072954 [Pisum sativum]